MTYTPAAKPFADVIVSAAGDGHYTSIATAVAANPGKTIYVRNGSYSESQLTIDSASYNGTTIIGESTGGVVWSCSAYHLYISSTSNVTNVTIKNIKFNNTGSGTAAIYANNSGGTTDWLFESCFFEGNSTCQRSLYRNSGGLMNRWTYFNCVFQNFTYAAFTMYGGSGVYNIKLVACTIFDCGSFGFDTYTNCKYFVVQGCTMIKTTGQTGTAFFTNGSGTSHHSVIGCNIQGWGAGINFGNSTQYSVATGNCVTGCATGLTTSSSSTGCIFVGNMNQNNTTNMLSSSATDIVANNYADS